MKLKVKTCCGCCDLHTGTLIVGIFGILFSVGGIITHTIDLGNVDETTKQEMKVGIGYSYLYVVINALLIYGTIKESRYFLLPWLVYVAIGLGVLTVFSFMMMFFYPVLISMFLTCVGLWYIWLSVLSYYQELNPTNAPPMSVYSGVTQVTTMAPTVVTYLPQPPQYVDVGGGPQVV